jgi:hypothetical protein
VLFHIPVLHSIDEHKGCVPLYEVVRQTDSGPVGPTATRLLWILVATRRLPGSWLWVLTVGRRQQVVSVTDLQLPNYILVRRFG